MCNTLEEARVLYIFQTPQARDIIPQIYSTSLVECAVWTDGWIIIYSRERVHLTTWCISRASKFIPMCGGGGAPFNSGFIPTRKAARDPLFPTHTHSLKCFIIWRRKCNVRVRRQMREREGAISSLLVNTLDQTTRFLSSKTTTKISSI